MSDPTEADVDQLVAICGIDHGLASKALRSYSGYKDGLERAINDYFNDAASFMGKHQWAPPVFSHDREPNPSSSGVGFHIESTDNLEVTQGVTPPGSFYASAAPTRPPSRTNNQSPAAAGEARPFRNDSMPALAPNSPWPGDEGQKNRLAEGGLPVADTAAAAATAAAAQALGAPKDKATEDADLERALRESAAESRVRFADQEVGVIDSASGSAGAGAVTFGPATREQYEPSEWGMVPLAGAEPSDWPDRRDVPPALRKRAPAGPGFLVQGNQADPHRLAGLITLIHSVPAGRNALLRIGDEPGSYGHCARWWDGDRILAAAAGDGDGGAPPADHAAYAIPSLGWGDQSQFISFDHELHRLLAFLDSSERAYASVDALASLLFPAPESGMEDQFYQHVQNCESFRPLLHAADYVPLADPADGAPPPDDPADDPDLRTTFGIAFLTGGRGKFVRTLGDAWDHAMWSDALNLDRETFNPEEMRMMVMETLAEIMAVSVSLVESSQDSIEIPPVWYPERYMPNRRKEAAELQHQWFSTKKRIRDLAEIADKRLHWADPGTGRRHELRDVYTKSVEHLRDAIQELEDGARFRAFEAVDFDDELYPDPAAIPFVLTDEDEKCRARWERRIHWFEDRLREEEKLREWIRLELELAQDSQRAISQALSDPSDPRSGPMTSPPYHLRGVATGRDTVYVCKRRAEGTLVDLDAAPLDQWWRLCLTDPETAAAAPAAAATASSSTAAATATAAADPVTAEKVELDLVLRNMWRESQTCLLLYVRDQAMAAAPDPLSRPLELFVLADNKLFRQELASEDKQEQEAAEHDNAARGRAVTREPRRPFRLASPLKRKYRASSADSMASNQAFQGDSDAESDPGRVRSLWGGPDMMDVEALEEFHDHEWSSGQAGAAMELMELDQASSAAAAAATAAAAAATSSATPSTGETTVRDTPDTIRSCELAESPVLGRPPTQQADLADLEEDGTRSEMIRPAEPEEDQSKDASAPKKNDEEVQEQEMQERPGNRPLIQPQTPASQQQQQAAPAAAWPDKPGTE